MIGWLKLTDTQRKTTIDQAAIVSGISTKAIEKDWWVTLTLKALFQTEYASYLIFKGGTSLSKCWKLIERFSEDIDIALDPRVIGMEYAENPAKSYLDRLKRRGCDFTSNTLKIALEKQFSALGVKEGKLSIEAETVDPTMPDKDPQTLFVKYQSLYDANPYLTDEVKIEVGIRSKLEPFAGVAIQSILNEVFPNPIYAELPFQVQAVEAHKTFLEKAFLLHEELSKNDTSKIRTQRMSRHFYDLEKMIDTEACSKALADEELYNAIITHRLKYNKIRGFDYETLKRNAINFLPSARIMKAYQDDYVVMREQMIYGESIGSSELFKRMEKLVEKFRQL